ncbi:mRNA-capping enzyme-like isoform X2 [Acyrthosiphon pisum]|uniref:Tyrosine specific protein phosphatases domain-containing protein n=1 Tax=Acyrthosiphon pisum TaxID=7029 RepID=A0A8R2A6U8_ACYPI|nr:mRNA-capping enzyme-like isoform X2 [Acyrthosiphon pisum]|eukprot:XP_003247784.2 PREDICTED: mRNA-capping enzyme-like isoform X2 [Acyrthosiphon pisum]
MSGVSRYGRPRRKSNSSSKIPRKWKNCPNIATLSVANSFVTFKTPLDDTFNNKIAVKKRFNPQMQSIGLWIDLTNTERYYSRFEVEDMGCAYVKLPCVGGGYFPTRDDIELFLNICYNFLANNCLQFIGVHCTHGFNRTGFLIVCYLVEVLDFDVASAIHHFAAARPPGIYRQNYIDELYRQYSNKAPTIAPNCHWKN